MAEQEQGGHEFLELRATDYSDLTFLGGIRLATRTWLFFLITLVAAVAFGALYVYVDRQVARSLDGWSRANAVADLVGRIEKGVARLRQHEKQFLLIKDTAIADTFRADLAQVTQALDGLFDRPDAPALQKHVATIRDGLAEYDQQFRDRVDAERALGLGDESGLAGRLKGTTEEIKARFTAAGFANLADQVDRINQQGQETLLSGFKKGMEELVKRYETLNAFVASAELDAEAKTAIDELLKAHETDMLTMINARFRLTDETERFDELADYVAPSLDALVAAASLAGVETAAALRKAQLFARYTLAGGSAAILLWLLMFGLMIIRSVTAPARLMAEAVAQLAAGSRSTGIPARGNADAFGTIARALDSWIDTLVDVDRLRQELDRTRSRLEQSLAEAQAEAEARRAPEPPRPAPAEPAAAPDTTEISRYASLDAALSGETVDAGRAGRRAEGPITSVSQQLQHFSQYVSAAANDVERTENLIRCLAEASRQLDDMADLVADIRDQTNMLAFRGPPSRDLRAERGDENLIVLSGEERGRDDGDQQVSQRFDAVRLAVDRVERTVELVRGTLEAVTAVAQDIAATASTQALEATHKLLTQSEYLQNMLDDVIAKIQPAQPGRLAGPDRPGELAPPDPATRRGPDRQS